MVRQRFHEIDAEVSELKSNNHAEQAAILGLDLHDLWIVLLLVGLFVISRLIWLWLNPFSSGYFEETYRWIVAQELLSKPVLPFLEYQADHYQGGSLVMIMLNKFYFQLFGKSIISFKLAVLTF